MKTIGLLILLVVSIQGMAQQQKPTQKKKVEYVYICDSGNTVKYHNDESCRGLARCKAKVVKKLKSKAKEQHDPCGYCAKYDQQ